MGLHGSPVHGPRMGSVTYRLLCLCPMLVLALPPQPRAVQDAERLVVRASSPEEDGATTLLSP